MKIVPMDKNFVLYRCLHAGLLSPSNIELKSTNVPGLPKEQIDRNNTFLGCLIDAYGSCAMLALEGEYAVGYARFYPEIVYKLADREHICCQDLHHSIDSGMMNIDLPAADTITEKNLRISCWFIHRDYRNRGLSHMILDGLLKWAREQGWAGIRASAAADNFWVASQACTLMLRTYKKHGFRVISTKPGPELVDYLEQIRQGQCGADKQHNFEKYCSGKDLSELAVYHKVEYLPAHKKTI